MPNLHGPVTLFHGSSISAHIILSEGLRAPDFTALVDRIAADHLIDPTLLRSALHGTGGAYRRENDRYVYLTGNRLQAMSYATRGGEFEELALGKVYEILHGETQIGNDTASERWIAATMGAREPVLVTINVPDGVELRGDFIRNYQIEHVPPDWVVDVAAVMICTCDHSDYSEPECRPRCPLCNAGRCPGWEALDARRPVERLDDDEWTDEEALNRQARRPEAT